MALELLISEYQMLETALVKSMAHDASARQRAHLIRQLSNKLDELERYAPSSEHEVRDQIYFFMRRAAATPDASTDERYVSLALMLARRAPRLSGEDPAGQPTPRRTADIIAHVSRSSEDVALIGTDYRIIARSAVTSVRRDQIHPDRLVGTHLADFIGQDNFEYRARPRLDACFLGMVQEYYFQGGRPIRNRIVRCQMRPVRVDERRPAALVYIHDVTDDIVVPPERLVPARPCGTTAMAEPLS